MRKINPVQVPPQGGILVVVSSLYLLSETELEHPSVMWVKHWDFHEAVKYDCNYVSDFLTECEISQVLLSIETEGDVYREALRYLDSKGVACVRKATLRDVRTLIRGISKTIIRRRSKMDLESQNQPVKSLPSTSESRKIAVFGVNLGGLPEELRNHNNLLLYDNQASGKFREISLDVEIKAAVLLQGSLLPAVFSRLHGLFSREEVPITVLAGGTSVFKTWIPTQDLAAMLNGSSSNSGSDSPIYPKPSIGRTYNGGETLRDLIKRFWVETGGKPQLLLKKIQGLPGRGNTKVTSIHSTKSQLLGSGWKPESSETDNPQVNAPIPEESNVSIGGLVQEVELFLSNAEKGTALFRSLLDELTGLRMENASLKDLKERNDELLKENQRLQEIVDSATQLFTRRT